MTTQTERMVEKAKEATRRAIREYCRARHNLWFAKERVAELREEYGNDELNFENAVCFERTNYQENDLDREVDEEMEAVEAWLEEQRT